MLNKATRIKDKQFILNFTSAVGVGLTMALTIRDTIKAVKLIDEDMDLKTKIKKTWKCYTPSGMMAISTILCIIYSDYTTMNQKISLLNALISTQEHYKSLKNSVDQTCSKKTKEDILRNKIKSNIPKDVYIERTEEKIFYEDYTNKFFTSTIDNVLKAEYLFNKQLAVIGYATLNDFYELLGISKTEEGKYIGWSVYDGYYGESTTNPWVDFEHSKMEDDDGCEYYYLNYSNMPEVIHNEL